MKTSSEDRSELISGIEIDAKKEAERIIADAQRTVSDKQLAKEMQLNSIKRDTDKKINQQVDVIEKNNISAISVEQKRIVLKIRETIINNVIEKIKSKLQKKANDAEYPEIIRSWILEAAIGLGIEEAVVSGAAKELEIMTDNFLKDTEKKYKELTGGSIKLVKSDKNPLFAQGIVLTSKENRTAFNNQVPVRLQRYHTEIRKIIYKEFFA